MGLGGPGGFPGLERLGLSDAQKDQVKSIMQAHRDDVKALMDRSAPARQALEAAIAADTVDEGSIRAHSADVASIDADMAVLQARIHWEITQVLTPDQLAQLKKMQTQAQQRLQQRRPQAAR